MAVLFSISVGPSAKWKVVHGDYVMFGKQTKRSKLSVINDLKHLKIKIFDCLPCKLKTFLSKNYEYFKTNPITALSL